MPSTSAYTTTAPGGPADQILDVKLSLIGGNCVILRAHVDGPYRGKYYAIFVNGVYTGFNYLCPLNGILEAAFPLTTGTEVGSVWLEPAGDWPAFEDYIPQGHVDVYEALDAKRLRFSWDNTYSLTAVDGDSQLTSLVVTGAQRGINVEYTDKLTRGRLSYTIQSSGLDHTIRFWSGTTEVAEDTITGDGAFSATAVNSSGLTVTGTLTYSGEINAIGQAWFDVRWPAGYQIHYSSVGPLSFPRTPETTVNDIGNDSFIYLSPVVGGATYYCSVLSIDDDGVVQNADYPAPAALVVYQAPFPPTSLYATGNAAACTIHWTASLTPNCEYRVASSLINEPVNWGQWANPAPQPILTPYNATSQLLSPITGYAGVDRTSYINTLKAAFDTAVGDAKTAYGVGETDFCVAMATFKAALLAAIKTYRAAINVNLSSFNDVVTSIVDQVSDFAEANDSLWSSSDWTDFMATPFANMLSSLGAVLCGDPGRYPMSDGTLGQSTISGDTLESACDPVILPGVVRVQVRARDMDGNEEHTDETLIIEFADDGSIVGSRPNQAYIESYAVTNGWTVTVTGVVMDDNADADATAMDLYVVADGTPIDYDTPSASVALAASVMNLQRANVAYTVAANGWYQLAVAARQADGTRSLKSEIVLAYLSDAAPGAVSNLQVKVIRGKGNV